MKKKSTKGRFVLTFLFQLFWRSKVEKDQVFKLRIDKKTRETLNTIARVEGVSKSEVVRQLIHQAVNQPNKQPQLSDCVELTH